MELLESPGLGEQEEREQEKIELSIESIELICLEVQEEQE